MVRVGEAAYDKALGAPHARPMDFTGRPLKGMVYVAPEGLKTDASLAGWIRLGLAFVESPPAARPRKRAAKR